MIKKTLLSGAVIGALVGAVTYAFFKAQRQFNQERLDEKKDKARWADDGGAPTPRRPSFPSDYVDGNLAH